MKLIERHRSRHTPAQIFDLVVDVEQYPDFVPWVIAARVTRRQDSTMWTNLTTGTGFLRKQFTTVALLDRPHRVEISSHDPMFERFEQIWTFEPTAEGGTSVEYRVDVRLKSPILQALIGAAFAGGARAIVKAYMRRAQRLYGTPRASSPNEQRSTVADQR
jgi:coenzyme Q-binding protein COQ10